MADIKYKLKQGEVDTEANDDSTIDRINDNFQILNKASSN